MINRHYIPRAVLLREVKEYSIGFPIEKVTSNWLPNSKCITRRFPLKIRKGSSRGNRSYVLP